MTSGRSSRARESSRTSPAPTTVRRPRSMAGSPRSPSRPGSPVTTVTAFVGDGPEVTDDRPLSEYFLIRRIIGDGSERATPTTLAASHELSGPPFVAIATPGSGPNRLLRGALIALWAILLVYALVGTVLIVPRFAVDLEIPLRAAERWMAGLPAVPGRRLPHRAGGDPAVPLSAVPATAPGRPRRAAARGRLGGVGGSARDRRRRRVSAVGDPVAVDAVRARLAAVLGRDLRGQCPGAVVRSVRLPVLATPTRRLPATPGRDRPVVVGCRVTGGLATFIGAIKVSQLQPWIYVLRHRPLAALGGLAVLGVIVLATLPLTGIDLGSTGWPSSDAPPIPRGTSAGSP